MITCQHCHGTNGEHVGFDCPEDPTRPPRPEERQSNVIAVLPSPVCELCGIPFNPSGPPQSCGGMPCLVPENEIIDWTVRARATPELGPLLGLWLDKSAPEIEPEWMRQAVNLAELTRELARKRGEILLPQLGPYCPTYLRTAPELKFTVRELELMNQERFMGANASPEQTEKLEALWARVAKHLLDTVCQRLQQEF